MGGGKMLVSKTSQLRTFEDSDVWMLAEDLPDMDLFFAQIWTQAFVNDLKNTAKINYRKVLGVFHGMKFDFYYGEKDSARFSTHLFGLIVKNPKFGDEINNGIKKRSDELIKQTLKFWEKDYSKFTNKQILSFIDESDKIHRKLYEYGWLSNATDMFLPLFTTKLRDYLKTKCKSAEEISAHLIALTAPEEETVAMRETKSFLRIAVKISNDKYHLDLFSKGKNLREKSKGKIKRLIEEHWKNYVHLKFMYHGTTESLDAKKYYEQFSDFIQENRNAGEERVKLDEDFKSKVIEKEKLFSMLKVDPYYRHLFCIFSEFMVTKWYRRNAQILTFYRLDPLFKEIGKRFGMSANQIRFMLPEEIKEMLLSGKVNKEEIRNRTEFCGLYTEENKIYVCTKEKAKALENLIVTKVHGEVSELRGQCACLGYAKGRVKIIQGAKDMHKFQKGDILVAYATDPDVVPAMKKAAAIVTEQGGVTCHAAIVARELKIPCVIGTKIATKVLRDGDLVEVDASKGIVRKLSR
jgi:phosphohistidine swiveling domain-containing protein